MDQLKVRQIAEAQGVTLSELQRRTLLDFGLLRRYWYNTSNGKADGPPLETISLVKLRKIASALSVQTTDLLDLEGIYRGAMLAAA